MEATIVRWAREGRKDAEIAATLTSQGHRSARGATVLPSTVKTIRLRHRVLVRESQSSRFAANMLMLTLSTPAAPRFRLTAWKACRMSWEVILPVSADRYWSYSRAWLHAELKKAAPDSAG